MKFNELSVGILIILSRTELDRVGILKKMKEIKGREIPASDLINALTKLLNTELISIRSDSGTAATGGPVEYYSITLHGKQLLKSVKTGMLKNGRIG